LLEYGIDYVAPCDAAELQLPDRSVDGCVSTNVLEHVPEKQIVRILTELRRVLKIDGVISAQIDYSDHYAHTDAKISLWNFLIFSDSEWSRHNHACHFQNRLRHYEYRQLFIECGFEILKEEPRYSSSPVPNSIASKYENDERDWSATSGYFVLKNSR
jgi:ubiquinone/menaquinone biosynthesis C-methylase UbiE